MFLTALRESNGNVTKAADAVGIARQTFYKWLKSLAFGEAVEEVEEGLIDHVEDALLREIDGGNITAIIFFLKTKGRDRGYNESTRVPDIRKPDQKSIQILDDFLSGDLTVVEACLAFEKAGIPVPGTLQTLLKNAEIEPDDIDGLPSIWDEAELEKTAKKYREAMAAIDKQQRDFLPQRQAEVAEMKKELSGQDSFSNENLDNKRS